MKAMQPIRINAFVASRHRGRLRDHDRVGQRPVQILPAGHNAEQQAMAVLTENRKAALAPGSTSARTAVIARQWKYLDPCAAWRSARGPPVSMADEAAPLLWRLRETWRPCSPCRGHGALVSIRRRSRAGWPHGPPMAGPIACKMRLPPLPRDTQVPRSRSIFPRLAGRVGTRRHRQSGLLCFPHTVPKGLSSTMSLCWMASGKGRKARIATPPAAFTTSR